MSDSVIVWLGLALLLVWAMGAYNRLVRLRAQGLQSFAALAGFLHQYVALVKINASDAARSHAPDAAAAAHDDVSAAWAGLLAAADQCVAALKVAHAHPFNGVTMKALRVALETLFLAWIRLRDLPAGLAGAVLPHASSLQWEQVSAQTAMARTEFNQRVVNYNEAIQQFPALLLAWVLGFKSAQPI
jgi:LemA protein